MERKIMWRQFQIICRTNECWVENADIISAIEEGCYDAAAVESLEAGISVDFSDCRFVQRYSAICARVLSAINCNTATCNTGLLPKVLDGTVRAADLGKMRSDELNPAAGAAERSEIALRKLQKDNKKYSTMHTCKKCGGRKTTKTEYQARAADESNTHSFKCANPACGHVWRY